MNNGVSIKWTIVKLNLCYIIGENILVMDECK